MKRNVLWITLASLMTVLPVCGELSLEEAVELALENDIRLLPGKTTLELAQLRQENSAIWQDPEFRLRTGLNADENYFESAFRFYLPHPWSLKADGLENASLTETAAAGVQLAGTETAVVVYRLYRDIQCLEKGIELADRFAEIKEEQAQWLKKLVEEGMETSTRLLELRWELREAKAEARALCREQGALQNRLAERTGLTPGIPEVAPLDFSADFEPCNRDEAIRAAMAFHPKLHLLRAGVQQADSRMSLARAERIPWFSHVQANYSDQSDEWQAQFAVSLPVFSMAGSKGRFAAAEQLVRQAAVAVSEQAVSAQVRVAWESFDSAAQEWEICCTEQAGLVEATEAEIEKLKEFAPSAQDELTLREQLVRSEQRLLKTLQAVYEAEADLLVAIGRPFISERLEPGTVSSP